MHIIKAEGAITAQAELNGSYVTLSHGETTLMLPALVRPDNYTETVYLADDQLQFLPGGNPVIAAVLACHAGQLTLTLFPLASIDQPEEA